MANTTEYEAHNANRAGGEPGGLFLPLWLVWLASLVFVGIGLGSYALMDNNEGLYAEIPREMLRSGDWRQWIIPHLNGLVYMEKPPLLYWLTAISFTAFGESTWSARLVPALSGLACVALILWFGRRVGRTQAGRLGALMFISGLGVTAMTRTLMFDMLLTAALTAALMNAYLFVVEQSKAALCRSMAFLALGVLAKGFVALILFCVVAGAFTLASSISVSDAGRRLRLWFDPAALGVFVLIAAPWHIAASLVEPIFAWFYFINEHVLRFLGRREPHDYYAGAWWYYLPRMVIYLFPWSFFFPVVVFAKSQRPLLGPPRRPLQIFLTLAWLLPVMFFSLSSAKANYYLVAVMPFAAFQLALQLQNRDFGSVAGRLVPGLALAALLSAAALYARGQNAGVLTEITVWGMAGTQFTASLLTAMAVAAGMAALLVWRKPGLGLLPFLILPLFMLMLALGILQAAPAAISTEPMAALLRQAYPDREVFLFRAFEEQSSLPFYLKHPVAIVDSRSNDLYWGNRLHRNDIVWSDQDLVLHLQTTHVALLVLDQDMQAFAAKDYYRYFHAAQKSGKVTLFLN